MANGIIHLNFVNQKEVTKRLQFIKIIGIQIYVYTSQASKLCGHRILQNIPKNSNVLATEASKKTRI